MLEFDKDTIRAIVKRWAALDPGDDFTISFDRGSETLEALRAYDPELGKRWDEIRGSIDGLIAYCKRVTS